MTAWQCRPLKKLLYSCLYINHASLLVSISVMATAVFLGLPFIHLITRNLIYIFSYICAMGLLKETRSVSDLCEEFTPTKETCQTAVLTQVWLRSQFTTTKLSHYPVSIHFCFCLYFTLWLAVRGHGIYSLINIKTLLEFWSELRERGEISKYGGAGRCCVINYSVCVINYSVCVSVSCPHLRFYTWTEAGTVTYWKFNNL